MNPTSVAQRYHQATKYDPDSLAASSHKLDWSRQPVPFKEYPGAAMVELGRYLPASAAELADSQLKGRDRLDRAEQGLNDLSHLLYFTNGVTEIVRMPERPFLMRAAPSAGGLYPTEIYLISRGRTELPEGLYNYQVRTHRLATVRQEDLWSRLQAACFDHPALRETDLAVLLTGVFYRSWWRYEDRAYRRILLDTGHVLGNLTLYAPLIDRLAVPIGGFDDQALDDLLFLDPQEEGTLAVVALPSPPARFEPSALPSVLPPRPLEERPGPRLQALHDASRIAPDDRPEELAPHQEQTRTLLRFAAPETLEAPPITWGDGLSESLLKRRSTRAYSGEACTREQLASILDFAYGFERQENRAHGTFDLPLLETFVAVHRVGGLEPGCYHYAPQSRQLRQIRFKDLTDDVQFLCLNQELGGQASAVVFHTADLPKAIARWGDRAYRYMHLDAGHVGERLNLAALHLGLGASGIGGFFDDLVNDLLGIPPTEAVVYITTIGVPASGTF